MGRGGKKLDMNGWKSEDGLEVIISAGLDAHRRTMWQCRCYCGQLFVAMGSMLKRGITTSCGCGKREKCRNIHLTHGKSQTRLYSAWTRMIQRCENQKSIQYKDYGGRGIRVCDRWRADYMAFEADMGLPPKGHSLERTNNDGDYSPENCKWAAKNEQANNKRNNSILELNNEKHTISEWAFLKKITSSLLRNRLHRGWSIKDAIETPLCLKRGPNRADRPQSQKNKARHAVAVALRRGLIIKPEHCQEEGCLEKRVEGHHHNGYTAHHELDVIWYCKKHHPREWSTTICVNGVTKTMKQWATQAGIKVATLRCRLASPYWTKEDAVTLPLKARPGGPKSKEKAG